MVWRVAWSLTAVSLPLAFTHPSKSSCTSSSSPVPAQRWVPAQSAGGTLASHLTGVTGAGQCLLIKSSSSSQIQSTYNPGKPRPHARRKLAPSSRKSPILSFPRPWSLGQATLKQLLSTARVPRPRGKAPLAPTPLGRRGPRGGGPSPAPVPTPPPLPPKKQRGSKLKAQHAAQLAKSLPHAGSRKPLPSTLVQEWGVPAPKLGNRLHS